MLCPNFFKEKEYNFTWASVHLLNNYIIIDRVWMFVPSKSDAEIWSLVLEVGGLVGSLGHWGESLLNGLVCPHDNEWALALWVPRRADSLKKKSLAPPFPLSLHPLHVICTQQLPFPFCLEWKLPEALTRSRCWYHASSAGYGTRSQINHFCL